MKVVCGWCKRPMGEQMGPDNLVTHGICADCRKDIDERMARLESSPTLAEVNARRGHE